MCNNTCLFESDFIIVSIEFICYDDGCHLRKFAQHSSRKDVTPTAQRLCNVNIVVDKLHMEGHTDKWCMANCDPRLFPELDNVSVTWTMYLYMLVLRKVFMYVCTQHTIVHTMLPCWMIVSSCVFQVDTEVCEQCFSWLSRYARITRRKQRSTFLFFTLYMCYMHNLREESKLRRSHYL